MSIKTVHEVVNLPIDVIKPYWKNPRKNEKTVDALVSAIQVIGFNVPLVVDKKYVVVKGHARLQAARKLGMQEVPCIITDNDDHMNRLDRIADNKIFELTQWEDPAEIMKDELFSIGEEDMFFTDDPVEEASQVDGEFEGEKQEQQLFTVVCPYCNKKVVVEL